MKVQHNSQTVKRFFRVIDTLHEFELVIAGYQSLDLFREMKEILRIKCRERNITVFDIDVSPLQWVGGFEDLLKKAPVKGNQYRVFNIIGLESHVKNGKVSIFLNHLNLIRNRLGEDYPYGFFFWMPGNLIKRFTLDAPDLWDWRNTTLIFEDKDRVTTLS
jgi:hypothetical protein